MAADLHIATLTSLAAARSIRDEWSALGLHAGVSPPMTAPVALAWLEHLNKGEPSIVTARTSDGRLVGVIPLHSRSVAGVRVLRWVGHGLGIIGEFVVDPDVPGVEDALAAALSQIPRSGLELVEMSRDGAGFASLTRESRLHYSLTEHETVPFVDLAGVASAADYLSLPGHRKLRQNMARSDRASLDLVVDTIEDEIGLNRELAEMVAVNADAEEWRPRLNLLDGAYGRFTRQSLVDSMRLGQAAVLVLRSEGIMRGFLVCFVSGDTAYAWLARFDPAAQPLGPGHQLLRAGIDWAIGRGSQTFDLQVGDDPYKLRWSSGTYRTVRLTVARSGGLLPAQLLVGAINRASAGRA